MVQGQLSYLPNLDQTLYTNFMSAKQRTYLWLSVGVVLCGLTLFLLQIENQRTRAEYVYQIDREVKEINLERYSSPTPMRER